MNETLADVVSGNVATLSVYKSPPFSYIWLLVPLGKLNIDSSMMTSSESV